MESRHFAFMLSGGSENDVDLYVLVNMNERALDFEIQEGRGGDWACVIDTGRESPDDICEPGAEKPVDGRRYRAGPHSVVVFQRGG